MIGGSLAGVTAVDELRRQGWAGTITLVGDEPRAAYARPPLSKGVLKGTEDAASVLLPEIGGDVEVLTGTRATGLDLDARRVRTAGGEEIPYDKLVIATGARARTLGDHGLVLRTLDDALRLRTAFARARGLLVIGGGFLGMEIASVAAGLGLEVTVVDLRAPFVSTLGPFLAGLFDGAAREHRVRTVVSPGV